MTSNERKVVNTAWAYLRDHAKTHGQQAIRDQLGRILHEDMIRRSTQRKKKEAQREKD